MSVVSTVPATTTSTSVTGPCTVIVVTASPAPSTKLAPKAAPSAATLQSITCWPAFDAGVSRWLWVTKRIGVPNR